MLSQMSATSVQSVAGVGGVGVLTDAGPATHQAKLGWGKRTLTVIQPLHFTSAVSSL